MWKHANALLALQPRMRVPIASKSGIWYGAMAKFAEHGFFYEARLRSDDHDVRSDAAAAAADVLRFKSRPHESWLLSPLKNTTGRTLCLFMDNAACHLKRLHPAALFSCCLYLPFAWHIVCSRRHSLFLKSVGSCLDSCLRRAVMTTTTP
jgi:hypothetical protein